MPMSPHERAKKAAAARWAGTTPDQRREATEQARASATPKPDTRLKRLRTEAKQLGYKLVKIEEEGDD